jgi:RHS repeat-associated protein
MTCFVRTNRWSAAKSNTVYKYDPVGNLTNVVYASGNTTNIVLRYDGLNRLTNMVDAAGTTAFGWTLGDQLASEDGPWASDLMSYSYLHRLRSAMSLAQPSAASWVQNYGYDELMRLTNVLSAAGNFSYEYVSAAGDRVQRLYLPNASGSASAYVDNVDDGLARLTSTALVTPVINPANLHSYSYDAGNQRTQQVFTAGNLVNYAYDNIGQLRSANGWEADGTTPRVQEQFGYGYDAAWNLQSRTNNVLVQTFNVDNRNQLTTATRSGTFTVAGTATERKGDVSGSPPGVTNVVVSGTGLSSASASLYEDGSWARAGATLANGNNSYTATASDTYGRSSQDSVTVNSPATSTFVYDLNGNLRTNNTRVFDYDDENQLIRITEPTAWKSEFTYDGMMRRRIRKEYTWSGGTWVKTNEMRYVYDARLVIQERDANNLPQVTYTRGNDLSGSSQGAGGIGGLLARTDNAKLTIGDPGANAYYHCDGNGNVTALVNTNGAIMARYSYDPFGNILSMSGPLAEANLYRFSSKELHVNSGLVYYLYRYYSPNLQRWVNRDPIEERGGINLYSFVFNNPINIVDLLGLDCYRQNRQLFPSMLNHSPWPRSRYNPISHTFIFTTNPDGTLKHTYSWGNTADPTGWNEPDRPEDVAAAKRALELGGNYLNKIGDSSLDKYMEDAFKDLKQNAPHHKNGGVDNNCKSEATNLEDKAKQLQEQAQGDYCTGD